MVSGWVRLFVAGLYRAIPECSHVQVELVMHASANPMTINEVPGCLAVGPAYRI